MTPLGALRRRESPAQRLARLIRYRALMVERYGTAPLRLNECKEHLS